MSLIAPVEDGKLVDTTTGTTTNASGSTMDKDSFLQLLVAQMKYQDPLEPTSNTEYISQYAQFTQVETMQNMGNNMDFQRASNLVGKEVYLTTTDSSGNTKYIQGKVDYVTYESGKAYLYINEEKYSLSDLNTVLDGDYFEAYNKAIDFLTTLNKLPAVGSIDLTYGTQIDELKKTYDEMSDYQKSFIATDKKTALQTYVDKIAELRKLAEDSGSTDDNQGTEDTK